MKHDIESGETCTCGQKHTMVDITAAVQATLRVAIEGTPGATTALYALTAAVCAMQLYLMERCEADGSDASELIERVNDAAANIPQDHVLHMAHQAISERSAAVPQQHYGDA